MTASQSFSVLETLDATPSRRAVLKRLAALGLVAAGGVALGPLAAEAKPNKGGKGGKGGKGSGKGGKRGGTRPGLQDGKGGAGKGQDQGQGQGAGQGQDADGAGETENPVPTGPEEPFDPDPGDGARAKGERQARLTLPDPTITAARFRVDRVGNGIVQATATGTINFLPIHATYMQQQLVRYAVTCEVWEADDNPDDFCFRYQTAGSNTTFIYPPVPSSRAGALRFSQQVASSLLNHDTRSCTLGLFCSGNDVDDVYARLILWSSFDGGNTWQKLGYTSTNEFPGNY